MEFLLVIGLIVLIALIMPKPNGEVPASDKLTIEKKQCPPHQWFYQEIVDQRGALQGTRICCKVCGPLKPQSGRDDEG